MAQYSLSRKLLWRVVFVLLIFLRTQPLSAIYFNHLGMEDGLGQLSVLSIYQDRLGRMWFGTTEGVSIFDGERIVTYKPTNQLNPLSSTTRGAFHGLLTHCIVGDESGNIFFQSDNTLVHYFDETNVFQEICPGGVHSLAEFQNQIYFTRKDTLFQLDPTSLAVKVKCQFNSPRVTTLFIRRNGDKLIGTRKGLLLLQDTGETHEILANKDIYKLYECSRGDLWISTRAAGLYRLLANGELRYYGVEASAHQRIASNLVREVIEDEQGNIWIGTFLGLYCYNPTTETLQLHQQDKLAGGLSHSSIYPIYQDRQGTIWLGTFFGGVNYFKPHKDLFTYYTDNAKRDDCLSYSMVGHIEEDKRGDLWIATEGGGLDHLNISTGKITHYRSNPQDPHSLPHNNIKSLQYDPKYDWLYIGTHTGGLARFDIATKKTCRYLTSQFNYKTDPSNVIVQTALWNDTLYVAASNGIFKLDPHTGKSVSLFPNMVVSDMIVSSTGKLWLGRINELMCYDLNRNKVVKQYSLGNHNMDVVISRIKEFHNHRICMSTLGQGILYLDETTQSVESLLDSKEKGISSFCYNIAETNEGNILISSDQGLSIYNSSSDYINHFHLGQSLPLSSVTSGCGLYVTADNRIVMGGADGMISFYEENIGHSSKPGSIYLSQLQVSNQIVTAGDETQILHKSIAFTDKLKLRHDQNSLVFRFAESNYIHTMHNRAYEYKLEGFDDAWIDAIEKNIYYTNIPPGDYQLFIRKKNNRSDSDYTQQIALPISIRSPWYATSWAITLWSVLTLLIAYTVFSFLKGRHRLRAALASEQADKEKREEISKAKLHFFTNISHEFRTPLTLIISHVDLLLQQVDLSPLVKKQVRKVHKQASQLQYLITELLDFRKMEEKKMHLQIAYRDVHTLLKDIFLSFETLALKHQINYRYEGPEEAQFLWLDERQMQKVFYNLLANAFKFTPDRGTIEVVLSSTCQQTTIRVIDSGEGISADELSKLFTCYFQTSNQLCSQDANPGTGLGLAFSQHIVELHGGEIKVESSKGYGSIFTIILPHNKAFFQDKPNIHLIEETQYSAKRSADIPLLHLDEDTLASPLHDPSQEPYKILIVDDNEDILSLQQTLFSPFYQVILARNGVEAMELAQQNMPDLIVSDIMMPKLSGEEMCMRLKKNINLCHIPIILLTALTTEEQTIKGLRCGADDYVTKPFDTRILLLKCNNMIRNRRASQQQFFEKQDPEIAYLATNDLDKEFLAKTQSIIDRHLDNTDFDVNTLVDELHIGRSTLFSKFKSLTGMTPNEFILNYKLQKAAQLLISQRHLSIADISFQFGFGSPRYFSKCFKQHYDVSPVEYRKSITD